MTRFTGTNIRSFVAIVSVWTPCRMCSRGLGQADVSSQCDLGTTL